MPNVSHPGDDDFAAPDRFGDEAVQVRAEGVLSDDAEAIGSIRIGEGAARPFGEAGEVIQHRRFHPVLRHGGGFGDLSGARLAAELGPGGGPRKNEGPDHGAEQDQRWDASDHEIANS